MMHDCAECIQYECSSYYIDCTEYDPICDYRFSRKKRMARKERNIDNSFQISNNCFLTVLTSSTTVLVPSTSSSVTSITPSFTAIPVTRTSISTPQCTPRTLLSGDLYPMATEPVKCSPGNDPFNPCTNIIDSDVLRVAIWLVILLSIGGNTLVITVTVLHVIRRYRSSHKEPSLMFMLYINLAFADLLMGIYLLTIAITDLATDGDYARNAIEWQTGHGCRFAGFCAIVSSLLSIFTLLVITIERVYSIKYALERKHFKKRWIAIVMLIGWIVGFAIAILPMVGVSSYGRVSICLPFESRDVEDKAYIALILILTGIASMMILVSYVLLFLIVACGPGKKHLHGSLSGREEMKIALRMSLLILTDFACWGPIAFFGLTAVFGKPLIGVSASKVLMVFVFPLNSCLNPLLYSFSTRLFRRNFCNLITSCRCCPECVKYHARQNSSSGFFAGEYSSSNRMEGHLHRFSAQMSLLPQLVSLMSFSSTPGSRRGSSVSHNSSSSFDGTFQNTYALNKLAYPSPFPRNSISSLNSSDSGDSIEPPAVVAIRTMREKRSSVGSLSGLPTKQLQALPEENEENEHFGTVTTNQIAVSDDSDNSTSSQMNGLKTYCINAAPEPEQTTEL